MEDLFEILYNTYLILLNKLEQGYPLDYKYLEDTWELIQLMNFVACGHPTEAELLWIADRYENTNSAVLDLTLDNYDENDLW